MSAPRDGARAFASAAGAGYGVDEGGEACVRPSIPYVAIASAGVWSACAASVSIAPRFDASALTALAPVFLAVAVVCAIGIAALRRRWAHAALSLLLGLAFGACLGSLFVSSAQNGIEKAAAEGFGEIELTATADGSATEFGGSCEALARTESGERYRVRVYLDPSVPLPRYGDTVTIRGAIEPPSERSRQTFAAGGVAGTVDVGSQAFERPTAASRPIVAIRNAAIDAVLDGPGSIEGRAAVAALACGFRGALDETGDYEAFKASGLAHVIAVSGSHLSLVVGIVACALRGAGAGPRASAVASAAFIAGYLVVSGMPVSAVRSAVMAVCGLASVFAGRRPSSLNGLGVCVAALVVADPACAASVSFALSAGSTAAIVLLAPLLRSWARTALPRAPRTLADGIALTGAASVGSTPLSAAVFSQVPLVSLPANLVAAPLFSAACALGLGGALLAVACPPLAPWALAPALPFAEALLFAARMFASAPFACVPASVSVPAAVAASLAIGGALWAAWPQPSRRMLAVGAATCASCLAALAVALPWASGDEIVALDVGQGDAVLVRSAGSAVLVDTGTEDARLLSALARHGVLRLDAVVVTHPDDDHCGSLPALSRAVEVDRVIVAGDLLDCACDACAGLRETASQAASETVGLDVGDVVSVGRFALRAIWPDGFSDEGGNADSLCFAVGYDVDGDGAGEWNALLVGDAEDEQLRELVGSGRVGDVDVYKVGHHGSAAAISPETAALIQPEIAIVSVGAGNRYGHPSPDALAALEGVGCEVLRTDERGDVSLRFSAERIDVATMR